MKLAVILARKGSKRLPGKNTKKLVNKSIIEYTMEEAIKSQVFDTIIISSDDDDILEMYKRLWWTDGDIFFFSRPKYLCNDFAPSGEAVLHAIEMTEIMAGVEYEKVCLLQPTSPLRTADDIAEAVLYSDAMECGVVSVNEETGKKNGAIYYDYVERLREMRDFKDLELYPMPSERSIDIDTEEDFIRAEAYMKIKGAK